ncbi:MAG: cytochrome c [Crocinitomicaceae bacterium]|nr:cytochrome c [Crocinitomicaceae bacterium]
MARLFKYVFLIGIFTNSFCSMAQNGEELYKNCFTCHTLGKNSTGPDLVGVRKQWVDAGEGDLLVDWVKDANAVITGGKSKMANEIKDFSPLMMPPFKLSTEEVNAIFDYIDSWQPAAPAAAAAPSESGSPAATAVKYTANYKTNLIIFYMLIALTFIILIAITLMSGSISALTDSTYFKDRVNKLMNSGGKALTIAIMVAMFFTGNDAMAMGFSSTDAHNAGQPWLLVENQDLYFMLLIDAVLIGVILYQRRLFSGLLNLVNNKKEEVVSEEADHH